ncbi:hypothetical protein [Oerskovia enterophila]|uniref:hypothetical protein n=1 Tax=Oerskovia enterophila TaxID=43678 RepID=UPI0037F93101
MADYRTTGSVKGTHYDHTGDIPPMTEAEFLGRPHPAVVDHTAAVVERVQALTPPSLVKLDRAEALVAAVVIWRNRELHGQAPGEEQYDSALDYIRDLTDRYIEATP